MESSSQHFGDSRTSMKWVNALSTNPSLEAALAEVVGSAIATSVGLSAGYVVWMLKGGSLMASVLSSLPAWQLADPLAILAGTKGHGDEDEDTLETIIKDGSGYDKDKTGTASELNKRKKESTKR